MLFFNRNSKKKAVEIAREMSEEAVKRLNYGGLTGEDWDRQFEYSRAMIELYLHEIEESRKGIIGNISPDTALIVLGNLTGILMILYFEKAGIITSKAINFVLKGRI